MDRVDLTINVNLPKELAEQAEAAGLLTTEQIERLLATEIERQKRLDIFFGKIERLRDLEPKTTPEEIDAEIEAYRREKRDKKRADGP